MTKHEEETLLADVKSITDRMDLVDKAIKAAGLGLAMVMAFRCGESGLYYPGDYLREWGHLYGIGLGSQPVSESLQSMYDQAPPPVTPELRDITEVMHPLRVSGSQMDAMLVSKEDLEKDGAIIAMRDARMKKRLPILWKKQLANPASKTKQMAVAWEKAGKVVV